MVHASISFLPASGPVANGEIINGKYEFTRENGPVAGKQTVLISLVPSAKFDSKGELVNEQTGSWEEEFIVPEEEPFQGNFYLTRR
jgi:hypothetical protein